jgi:PII-like signaling protein
VVITAVLLLVLGGGAGVARYLGTKQMVYFSERARVGNAFLADRLVDVYARHRIHTCVMLRGADGFGAHHRLHTDRLLSASENLPAVSIAVDTSERIEAARSEVETLTGEHGLVTSELVPTSFTAR